MLISGFQPRVAGDIVAQADIFIRASICLAVETPIRSTPGVKMRHDSIARALPPVNDFLQSSSTPDLM